MIYENTVLCSAMPLPSCRTTNGPRTHQNIVSNTNTEPLSRLTMETSQHEILLLVFARGFAFVSRLGSLGYIVVEPVE
ncbi:hypothetical protein TNCT_717321 [Trichonephila clavata]|uniref:Uncharacterized protein n=1 Tax=Trichonephila clavata TaxID=2740835 RepID=A0A8X6IZL8_TRICU|nr:hypothetical protein TNCT_717321 [Trichonephila clavata]